jgi:hypothetical protein
MAVVERGQLRLAQPLDDRERDVLLGGDGT